MTMEVFLQVLGVVFIASILAGILVWAIGLHFDNKAHTNEIESLQSDIEDLGGEMQGQITAICQHLGLYIHDGHKCIPINNTEEDTQ